MSELALRSVFSALDSKTCFKLEAGAGAGKTYSLIAALQHVLSERSSYLPRPDQQIACLTYTNVARDEIIRRTDASPFVFADTLHGFLWEMIRPYQKALAHIIVNEERWRDTLEGRTTLQGISIDYDLGFRGINDHVATLHHDDVPTLAIGLFKEPKFRALIADRFPIVFIDEYQDTPQGLVEAMLSGQGQDRLASVYGFFGDHWQQIYDKTCGSIDHASLTPIPKNANFRSGTKIIEFLNHLRPELQQAPAHDAPSGSITIYHTNNWPGVRLGSNWKGQISHAASRQALKWSMEDAQKHRWVDGTPEVKTLMLTHTAIANELGYGSLPAIFKYNDAFVRKDDPVIAYLLDIVEPAAEAFNARQYGALINVLGRTRPHLRSPRDKKHWHNFFTRLNELRTSGTVGEVVEHVAHQTLFSVPTKVQRRQIDLDLAISELEAGEPLSEPRRLVEFQKLKQVPYSEIQALASYLHDKTVFSTKHNVKGAEFDNVAVLLGRGWSAYDFAKMLENYPKRNRLSDGERRSFERSRNLFYVAVSRAKHNLALVFTQTLEPAALATLTTWVGDGNVVSMEFSDELTPIACQN
ncbi:UvrD-helicase domain-containing protein [Pseudarthrobacter siccitolerans]